MTQGRLRRESNPTPGEEPGFTPQHESSTPDQFVTTGEGNPLPTKDADVHSRLDQIEEKLDNIAGTVSIDNDESNAIPTQLTGSKVEPLNLTDEFGTIPAGTSKKVLVNDFIDESRYKWSKASVFYRRTLGEYSKVELEFNGTKEFSTAGIPRVDLSPVNSSSNGIIAATEKVDLLTNNFYLVVTAKSEEDLEAYDVSLFLWEV